MSDAENKHNPGASGTADNGSEATVAGSGQQDGSSIDPQSIEGLFLLALQKDIPADREAFLNDVCADDSERRRRIEALLKAYNDAGSFLETPAGGPRPQTEISLSFLKPIDKDGYLGTIGPYEVLDVIGRGGMGLVLRAVDTKLNRVVAVKVLLPELAANPSARRRFLREAQAAAAISHPHVVTIHAVDDISAPAGETGTPVPPYLVMECVVGQSLQQKLDQIGPLRLHEILRISGQIAEGLVAAHKQGVIHRDIKPANILLENGVERVKITDFGLARAIDDITVTRTGEVSGTPQYMSPEQACGERVDHRSDLFSLGCVMYAMCTGHSPFRGDTIAHVIKRVTQDTPRSISDQNAEIPLWLVQIIECLLLKNPGQRIQSAEGLVAILEKHLARVQQPTESGFHTLINQQLLQPADVSPQPQYSHTTAEPAHRSTGSREYLLPGWLRTCGRILVGLGAALFLVALVCIPAVQQDALVYQEVLVISAITGLWSVLMGLVLRCRQMSRGILAGALFLGLGPLGLLFYLVVRDQLVPTEDLSRFNKDRAGVYLIGAGAMVIFLVAAWMLLVAFDLLPASAAVRRQAGSILASSMTLAFLLIAVGMMLREQILGHEVWMKVFTLVGYGLLGPLGIYLWIRNQNAARQIPTAPRPPHQQTLSYRIGTGMQYLGASLIPAGVIVLILMANHIPVLQNARPQDSTELVLAVGLLAGGIIVALTGAMLKDSGKGRSTSPLIFYLLLGPIGLILWLVSVEMHRQRREQVSRLPQPTTPPAPEYKPAAADQQNLGSPVNNSTSSKSPGEITDTQQPPTRT